MENNMSSIECRNDAFLPARNPAGGLQEMAAQSREIAEIQSAMVIAQRFPRDEKICIDRILTLCQRQSLAQKAMYSYARGGTEICGPSINLAKAVLQRWKNCTAGIRELEDNGRESLVEAFAYDLENNYKEIKQFRVPHVRHTKKGDYRLTDPRDVYELVANNGSRRERACILSIIPSDVIDMAVDECMKTLRASADCSPENVKKMTDLFLEKFGITKEQIEGRIQRRIDTITPAQVVSLRNIYNSLSDGMSAPEDWFEKPQQQKQPEASGKPSSLREALKGRRKEEENQGDGKASEENGKGQRAPAAAKTGNTRRTSARSRFAPPPEPAPEPMNNQEQQPSDDDLFA